MDKLEKYINENREYLDRYSPSHGVWKRIRLGLKERGKHSFHWLLKAAMIIVIIGSAVVIYRHAAIRSFTVNKMSTNEEMVQTYPQLKETELYYTNLVKSLYRQAAPMLTANPEIEKELNNDILQLDSIFSEIRKDLKDNLANREVVEAMIQNYRKKIHLLEDILIILKEHEDYPGKNNNHEL